MILHHFQNRQKKNSGLPEFSGIYFLEKRGVFFADMNTGVNAGNVSAKESIYLSEDQKKKEKLEIRETNRERLRIKKIIKNIEKPEDIVREIKDDLSVFYAKNPDLVSVVLKEQFQNKKKFEKALQTLQEDASKEQQAVESFFFHIKGNTPDSSQKALLMKVSPQKFLKEYIGDDTEKRKNYFRALSYLHPEKSSTLAFVKKCNTKEFSEFLTSLAPHEQEVFLRIFTETNHFHNTESLKISQLKNNEMIKNIISYARDESLQSMSQEAREKKMLDQVRNEISLGNTGKKTSEKIQKELEKDEHKNKSEIERQKIFFRILREASSKYLANLKHSGREEILDAIENSRKFYTGLFAISSLSDTQKSKDLREIEKIYNIFIKFFSGKKNGDVARFYLENKGLTAEEVREIDAIENKK